MSDEVKNRPQLLVGLINEILPEVIFIRMDQPLWEFFRRTTVLLLCRDATLQWDTLYIVVSERTNRNKSLKAKSGGSESISCRNLKRCQVCLS
jgi:hypothetical protein